MGVVSLETALRKGKFQLFWMPMILFFLLMLSGIAFLMLESIPFNIAIGITLFLLSFILPWLWWSFKVVKWKIWAFANVDDIKTLEKRAIAMQLIWPKDNWFEKTEIKTKQEKQVIDWLYHKMENASIKKEPVIDRSLPPQLIIHYPKNFYFYPIVTLVGLYLLYAGNYFLGPVGIIMGLYMTYDSYRKVKGKKFFMKIDSEGITLHHAYWPWKDIHHYYIERQGFGDSTTYDLIIEMAEYRDVIPLSDINTSAFKIERYLDVYRTRFDAKPS
jgi:hypothetical protein